MEHWVFDLDRTLMMPDDDIDRANLYQTIDHLEHITEMMEMFRSAKMLSTVTILTMRHPDLAAQLSAKFGCNVICRNFCTDMEEVARVDRDPYLKGKFFEEMFAWKTGVLNNLAKDYDKIHFYDDLMEQFDHDNIASNVVCKLPTWMC